MSVLIECINVIVRNETIEAKFKGGLEQYILDCPNQTFCTDGYISRIGFMAPPDVRQFIEGLERHGFVFLEDGKAMEITVVDYHYGFMQECDWLYLLKNNKGIATCTLIGQDANKFAAPAWWSPEEPAQSSMTFIPNEEENERIQILDSSDGVQTLFDRKTGEVKYMGRTI